METYTNDEAKAIFHEALLACGKQIVAIAEDLAKDSEGLTGDDSGDDFNATVVCTQWLEHTLNINEHDFSAAMDSEYRKTWFIDVLVWAQSVDFENYDAATFNEESAKYDPTVAFWAWDTAGAPSCKFYDILHKEA